MSSSSAPAAAADAAPRLLWLAAVSGILSGCAFAPVDWKWLAWIGLIPLALAVARSRRPSTAFFLGYLAGLIFFLLTLHPLVSAHAWSGWRQESPAAFAARMGRQWWFLNGVWLAFAALGAAFWGAWAWLVRRLFNGAGWRALLGAVSLWVLVPEWLRAQATFGYTWALLGNAAADWPAIRQLAAFGGVWLLSALLVAVNLALAALLRRPKTAASVRAPVGVLCGALALAGVGAVRLHQPMASNGSFAAAALQRTQPSYTTQDFLETGLDRSYLPMVHEALSQEARLVMLPESIVLGAASLDGTPSRAKPARWLAGRAAWDRQMRELLAGTEAVLILGLDTVEGGRDHNTLIAWTAEGAVGWYHKQRLVPFSEYQPSGWGAWIIRGESEYSPGAGSQLIRAPAMVLGGFICQEVLLPSLIRHSVRDGATILITGGNDGVFGDAAVAAVHADAAQLRAVEAGRYLVRAMKSGISAIIDPRGRELARSRSDEPAILTQTIGPQQALTPYVRLGDWVMWLAAVGWLAASLFAPRHRGRSVL